VQDTCYGGEGALEGEYSAGEVVEGYQGEEMTCVGEDYGCKDRDLFFL
jgi:hypothetical protein